MKFYFLFEAKLGNILRNPSKRVLVFKKRYSLLYLDKKRLFFYRLNSDTFHYVRIGVLQVSEELMTCFTNNHWKRFFRYKFHPTWHCLLLFVLQISQIY